jgi:hypothetical protein
MLATSRLLLAIGSATAPAQPCLPQGGPTLRLSAVPSEVREREVRERFVELIGRSRASNLAEGWELASSLGNNVAPVLWKLREEQGPNLRQRVQVLAGAVLAGGPDRDRNLFDTWRAEAARPQFEERLMGLLLFALGPRREQPVPDFWKSLRNYEVLAVAGYTAAERLPEMPPGAPAVNGHEPGILAAALLARAAEAEAAGATFLADPKVPHSHLIWRGLFLGYALQRTRAPEAVLEHAARQFADESAPLPVRQAAALLLARSERVQDGGARPTWELLQCLASTPAAAQKLQRWLLPEPGASDEDPRRLAVEYAFGHGVNDVITDMPRWLAEPKDPVTRKDPRVGLALALALRLLDVREPVPPIEPSALPELWFAARLAGKTPAVPTIGDPQLQQAATLLAADRLPRAVLRTVLEEALWRQGSHPGLCLQEARLLLIRDLLLTGTNAGSKYGKGFADRRYYAKDSKPEREVYEVAVELFEYLNRPRLPLPPELRLP